MEMALKMSMQADEELVEEVKSEVVEEEKLIDVPMIELSQFNEKVKASVVALFEALVKGVRQDKLSLEVDSILALIKVAVVGPPQKQPALYGEH